MNRVPAADVLQKEDPCHPQRRSASAAFLARNLVHLYQIQIAMYLLAPADRYLTRCLYCSCGVFFPLAGPGPSNLTPAIPLQDQQVSFKKGDVASHAILFYTYPS